MNLWEQTYPTLLQHLQQKLHFSWKFGDNHVRRKKIESVWTGTEESPGSV